MITIERVTPKTTATGKVYVLIEASGKTYSSWDPNWQQCVGREVPLSVVTKDKKGYLNLPNVADVFATPQASSPAVSLPQTNGIAAQQTANERYEILNRKIDAVLEILRDHFRT